MSKPDDSRKDNRTIFPSNYRTRPTIFNEISASFSTCRPMTRARTRGLAYRRTTHDTTLPGQRTLQPRNKRPLMSDPPRYKHCSCTHPYISIYIVIDPLLASIYILTTITDDISLSLPSFSSCSAAQRRVGGVCDDRR